MWPWRLERLGEPLASSCVFWCRLGLSAILALAFIGLSVLVGAITYYFRLRPDGDFGMAVHRAAMILSGMGPVETPEGNCERVFVDVYALLGTLVLTVVMGLILTPIFHRVLHRFHLDK